MMDMESRPFQAMPENEYSPCSIEHQDVFMYEDEKNVRTSLTGERADSPTYLDISASKTSAFTNMKTESDPDTLLSWTHKHPEHWSQNEILDWIYFVASEIKVDPATIRGEGFQNISGPELCRMTLDDFKKADPVNGQFFYEMFHELHKDAFFISPSDLMDSNMCQQITAVKADIKQEFRVANCDFVDQKTDLGIDNIVMNGDELQVLIGQMWYPIDPYMTGEIQNIIDSNPLPETDSSSSGYASSCSDYETMSECSDSNIDTCRQSQYPSARTGSCGSEIFSDDEMSSMLVSDDMKKETSPKRKAVQKRKQKSGEPTKPQNRGRKPGQISKGNHLWEFIRDLLKDSKYNPHLLRWEEKETGVFRFVQSEAVAQMWGRKKNNPGMTYEKLSRAMRFCRTAGYFAEVPKTGKFPKKLCFRFGSKACGWAE